MFFSLTRGKYNEMWNDHLAVCVFCPTFKKWVESQCSLKCILRVNFRKIDVCMGSIHHVITEISLKIFQDNNVDGKKYGAQQNCMCAGAFCKLRSNEGKVYPRCPRYGVRSMRQPCMVSVDWRGRLMAEVKVLLPCVFFFLRLCLIMVIDIYRWIWQLELYSTSR